MFGGTDGRLWCYGASGTERGCAGVPGARLAVGKAKRGAESTKDPELREEVSRTDLLRAYAHTDLLLAYAHTDLVLANAGCILI
eukprot:744653-Rhodomonas_salina.5